MEMTLVDAPAVTPFTCVDGSQSGPVVDTQLTHAAYGRMYWPERLVVEAARLYGMVSREEQADMAETLLGLQAKLSDAEGRLAELAPIEESIRNAKRLMVDADDAPPRRRKVAA